MEIQYVYTKPRYKFGRSCNFTDRCAEIHVNIPPDPSLATNYIERNPAHRGVQCIQEMSEHEVNTERRDAMIKGINHTEGGWPRDVNIQEGDQTSRFRKKIEKDENYISVIQSMGDVLEHCIKQNNALDIYESYFCDVDAEATEDPPSAKTISIFRDPHVPQRTASNISWYPDASKLAVAYCDIEFSTSKFSSNDSFIWDINNSSRPDMTIKSVSPLVCLEYNPKDCHILIGGLYSGQVACWDTRKGSQPVETSVVETSHREAAWKVMWVQSKTGTECFSTSTDGQVLWWDIRKLTEPIETFYLDPTKKQEFEFAQGAYVLEYECTIPTKFMAGTENGMIFNCNRKGKTPAEKVQNIYSAHHGPVYALQRNPAYPKVFLSVGDWTAKIWSEEMKDSAIIWTSNSLHALTDGCWSPVRPGVFFTTKMNGKLDVWDLLFKQSSPTLSIQVCDESLHCLRVQEQGQLVACGSHSGTITLLDLSQGFWVVNKAEKAGVSSIFDRGVLREKINELRIREIKLKMKQQEDALKLKTHDSAEIKEEPSKTGELESPLPEEEDEDPVEIAERDFFQSIEQDRKKKEKKEAEKMKTQEEVLTVPSNAADMNSLNELVDDDVDADGTES